MRFFSNLGKSKDLRAFESALEKGDYTTAVELANSGQIPQEQVQEAKVRLKLSDAFWNYGSDVNKTAYFDQILSQ